MKTVKIKAPFGDDFLEFSYKINVTTEGVFTTTIPPEISRGIVADGFYLKTNRMNNPGYFEDVTMKGLQDQVSQLISEYTAKELIDEVIVLRYAIETACSYSIAEDGEFYPRISWGMGELSSGTSTLDRHSSSTGPYGLWVYCKPYVHRTYKYLSGKTKSEYERWSRPGNPHSGPARDVEDYWLCWLSETIGMSDGSSRSLAGKLPTKEIPYTEARAKFFADLLKATFKINEMVAGLDEERILQLADSGQRLLQ